MPSDHIDDVIIQLYVSGHRRLPVHVVKCVQEHLGVCELCGSRFEQYLAKIPPLVTTSSDARDLTEPMIARTVISNGKQPVSDLPLPELLEMIKTGDSRANEHLWSSLYDDLHRIAASQLAGDAPDQSLQPTLLVNEVYLQLVSKSCGNWHDRREFLTGAANAMRFIRVVEARKQIAQVGDTAQDANTTRILSHQGEPEEVTVISDALNRLEIIAPRQAAVVVMRYFGGLSVGDTAQVLGISPRTVEVDWRLARAWLHRDLSSGEKGGTSFDLEAKHWDSVATLFREAIGEQAGNYASVQDGRWAIDNAILSGARSLVEHDKSASTDFLALAERPSLNHHSQQTDVADAMIGMDVDGYCIQRLIAVGGNGNVYEAVNGRSNDRVALKLFRHFRNSRESLRYFEEEARILARLHHEHVARFRFAGTCYCGPAKLPYFAMELVAGATNIIEYASQRRLSIQARLGLFADVCAAAAYMHSKGIVHRDFKPANILVSDIGKIKVVDFGVAHLICMGVAPTTHSTDVGYVVGTLQYMSPEQCEADPAGIDERSDVYSLGVILYELLAGRLPYDVTERSIYRAVRTIMEAVPNRPSDWCPLLDRAMDAIILKALSKERNGRYQSATELLHAIESWSKGGEATV